MMFPRLFGPRAPCCAGNDRAPPLDSSILPFMMPLVDNSNLGCERSVHPAPVSSVVLAVVATQRPQTALLAGSGDACIAQRLGSTQSTHFALNFS
jgi:hypothetical protein